MKNFLLIATFVVATFSLNAQCTVTKCIGASATADITNGQVGWTYAWTSALPGFTGQGTASITWANVGVTPGVYAIDVTITNGTTGCDTTVICSITIVDNPVVTLVLPPICFSNSNNVALTGGSPAGGTYSIGGLPATTISSSNIGNVVSYSLTSGGCTGSTTDVLGGIPSPNATITIN